MTNRNKIKQWFITYPQWLKETKIDVRDKLISSYSIDYYKICKETHEDGNPHFHAVIRLREPMSKSQIIKRFKEIYINEYKRIDVKPVRSIKHSLQYLSKEDTTPLESAGGFVSKRNPKNSILTTFVRQLGYASLSDFNEQYGIESMLRRQLETDMLKCNAQFELLLTKELSWPELSMIPEINRFYEIRRKISNIYLSISIDDMTFFIKFYKTKVVVLLTRGDC
jgi:hypothetical protein